MLSKKDIKTLNRVKHLLEEHKDIISNTTLADYTAIINKVEEAHTKKITTTRETMATRRKDNPYYGRSKEEINRRIKKLVVQHFDLWVQDYDGQPEDAVYTYIMSIQYDIEDNLDQARQDFNVPKDYTDADAIDYISTMTETILTRGGTPKWEQNKNLY